MNLHIDHYLDYGEPNVRIRKAGGRYCRYQIGEIIDGEYLLSDKKISKNINTELRELFGLSIESNNIINEMCGLGLEVHISYDHNHSHAERHWECQFSKKIYRADLSKNKFDGDKWKVYREGWSSNINDATMTAYINFQTENKV